VPDRLDFQESLVSGEIKKRMLIVDHMNAGGMKILIPQLQ